MRARTSSRTLLTLSGAVLLSLLCALLVLEGVLRASPSLFGNRLLNHAFSKYGTFPGGIYFREPVTGTLFMRPGLETVASWNGYFWRHSADGRGFRNPESWKGGEILLLGDSLIYGHGVEQEETVASVLRTRHGHRVYNMSRQGDSLYQHYILLRLHLEELRPKKVVLFFFVNDFFDVETYRSPAQLAAAPELKEFDYDRIRASLERASRERSPHLLRWLHRSAALRLLKGLAAELRASMPGKARAAGQEAAVPDYLEPYRSPRRFSALSGYYRLLLGDLAERCRAAGADLVLVNLALEEVLPEAALAALDMAGAFLESLASDIGFTYIDTRELFRGCGECFLDNDGHFTKGGHRRLAAYLDREALAGP